MESLDRPYGDDEQDYRTVHPEPDRAEGEPAEGDLEDIEETEAGAEAARIGWESPDDEDELDLPSTDDDDNVHSEAFRAVEEGGGGVSEGFETAEGQLIENIEDAPEADLTTDAFDLEDPGTDVDEDAAEDVEKELDDADPGEALAEPRDEEARRATAEYGEPDQVDTTEVVRDPEEESEHGDDAGRGPGIAFDR